MTSVREATQELLADSPSFEDALEALLEIDTDGPFEFDDIPLDSGQFGEVVSAGIVEKTGDGYRVADRDAVRQALDSDTDEQAVTKSPAAADSTPAAGQSLRNLAESVSNAVTIDRRSAGALLASLLVVALSRTLLMWNTVFRNGDIVLAGNDPYLYRYWGETLLASSLSAFDPTALGSLPNPVPTHDTITIVGVWWASALLGGDSQAVGLVVAWYPVVAGVLTAFGCYLLAVWLTEDRRIGLATVLLLAFTPTHAYRTALGFGDHHAADYVWLVLVALAVVWLARERITLPWADSASDSERAGTLLGLTPPGLGAVLLLGTALAGQTHAWRGGPLLSIPIGLYLVGQVSLDVGHDRSTVAEHGPLLAGLAVGAGLAALLHLVFGWAPVFRAFAPALLLVGALGVVALGELARRVGLSARATVGATLATGVGGTAIAFATIPAFGDALDAGIRYFTTRADSGIAETYSLFAAELGSIVAPILFFGFVLFLAIPYMAWGTWYSREADRPDWVAAVTFAWYFLLLAIIQSRFAGQLSLFTAVFGGVGFVHLAAVVEATGRPAIFSEGNQRRPDQPDALDTISLPDSRVAGALFALFLLVASLGMLQTGVKQSQIAIDDDTYEAAAWVGDHADRTNRSDRYVFSPWGRNRVYNSFAGADYRSYFFAQANYGPYMTTPTGGPPTDVYDALDAQDTGYVVTTGLDAPPDSLHARLHQHLGSNSEAADGLGRFRLLYRADDGSPTVFGYVPGATLTGAGPANETFRIQRQVNASGASFTYERTVSTNRYGDYGVTVPYAGSYTVAGESHDVSDEAVESGAFSGSYRAHFPFDEGAGSQTVNTLTGESYAVNGTSWVDGVRGSALSLEGREDGVYVGDDNVRGNSSFTVSFWVKGSIESNETMYPTVLRASDSDTSSGYGFWARRGNNFGIAVDDTDGTRIRNFGIQQTEFEHWTHIAGVVDRDSSTLRLYRNSTLVSTTSTETLGAVDTDSVYIGGQEDGRSPNISVEDARVYANPLSTTEIRRLHTNLTTPSS